MWDEFIEEMERDKKNEENNDKIYKDTIHTLAMRANLRSKWIMIYTHIYNKNDGLTSECVCSANVER